VANGFDAEGKARDLAGGDGAATFHGFHKERGEGRCGGVETSARPCVEAGPSPARPERMGGSRTPEPQRPSQILRLRSIDNKFSFCSHGGFHP
jgi:hypothetical protein